MRGVSLGGDRPAILPCQDAVGAGIVEQEADLQVIVNVPIGLVFNLMRILMFRLVCMAYTGASADRVVAQQVLLVLKGTELVGLVLGNLGFPRLNLVDGKLHLINGTLVGAVSHDVARPAVTLFILAAPELQVAVDMTPLRVAFFVAGVVGHLSGHGR